MKKTLESLSPNTGQPFADWQPDTRAELRSIRHRLSHDQEDLEYDIDLRRQTLDMCASALMRARDRIAEMVVVEVGKKPAEAYAEIDYAAAFLAECRRLLDGRTFRHSVESGRTVSDVAIGGALLICPFNDPIAGLTRKIAPAVAAGCPAIVKPSALAVHCARTMFEEFRREGVDRAVYLFAPDNYPVVREALMQHEIGILSFTGSTKTGRSLARSAGGYGKKAIMELGGNCPFVVFDDADLDRALEDLFERKLKAAGQACSSVNRVFAEEPVYKRFRDMVADRAASTTLGVSDGGFDLGPVRTLDAAENLAELVAISVLEDERLLTPMPSLPAEGQPFLFPLTVVESFWSSLFDSAETFGPLLSIRSFADREAMLGRLSIESHALAAYFYTGDPDRLIPRLRHLRFGSIGVNSTAIQGANVPTGGFGDAGVGREGGAWGMNEFLTTINVKVGDGFSLPPKPGADDA